MDIFEALDYFDSPKQKNIPEGWYKSLVKLQNYGISMFGLASIFSVTEQTVINWLNFEHTPNTSNANLIVSVEYLIDKPDEFTKSMKNMKLIKNETLWNTSIKLLSESKETIDGKKSWKEAEKETIISFITSLVNISNLIRESLNSHARGIWLRRNLLLVSYLGQGVK